MAKHPTRDEVLDVLREIAPLLRAETRLAWATKGFELDTGLLPWLSPCSAA